MERLYNQRNIKKEIWIRSYWKVLMLCSTSSIAEARGFPLSRVSSPASCSLSLSIRSARVLSSLPGMKERRDIGDTFIKIQPRPLASIFLQADPGLKATLAAPTARSTSALEKIQCIHLPDCQLMMLLWQTWELLTCRPVSLGNHGNDLLGSRVHRCKLPTMFSIVYKTNRSPFIIVIQDKNPIVIQPPSTAVWKGL